MKNQRLGFVGLEHDTASACLSMLKIMDGRSGVHWSESEPDSADVLMISSEATAETQHWSSSTKPRIVVYPAGEAKPASAFTLAHPFRVMQLIGVLEEVAESLSGVASGDSQAEPESSLELFWESLHKQMQLQNDVKSLCVAQSPMGEVYIRPSNSSFYARPGLLKKLASGKVSFNVCKPWTGTLPHGLIQRPLFELLWCITEFTPMGLAPWLKKDRAFRLKRWPSFGTMNKSRTHLALCALMSKGAFSLSDLQHRVQCDVSDIHRFINTCDMTGLVVCDDVVQPLNNNNTQINNNEGSGRFGGLIKGLRSRLGLSA